MAISTRAYKLFRQRKDGSLGSLFIGKRLIIEPGKWYKALDIETKGFQHRPGWHAAPEPYAPHLSTKGRVWCEVELRGVRLIKRPKAQGNAWYLATQMRVVRKLEPHELQTD